MLKQLKLIVLTTLTWVSFVCVCFAQQEDFALLQDIEATLFDDPQRAANLLKVAQNSQTISDSDSLKSFLFNLLAYQHILNNEFPDAVKDLDRARTLAILSNNAYQQAESLRREGLVMVVLGQYSQALTLLNESIKIHERIESPRYQICLENILNIYEILEQFDKLEQFSWMLLEVSISSSDFSNVSAAHHRLGISFLEQGNLQRAEYHFNQEMNAHKKSENPFLITNYYGLARLAFAREQFETALEYIDKAKAFIRGRNFAIALPEVLRIESRVRHAMGQHELAIQILNRAIYLAQDNQSTDYQISALRALANIYFEIQDFENAYRSIQQANEVAEQSQLFKERQLLAINQARLDLDTKNREINKLKFEQQLDRQRLNTQLALLVSTLLVITILMFFAHRLKKQKEALSQASKKLKHATEAKSDFLARMSHEIRTPINAIIGLTKLSLRGSEDERQATNLKQIEESSQALLGIINDILDFSKIEAGKLTIECAPFNIDEVIGRAIRLNSIKAQEKGLEIVQFVARDVPLTIEGDAFRLQQVLNNLLSNAVKFTEKGSVSVIVNRQYNEGGLTLQFQVKDTGKGLTTAQKNSLFDSFTQEDESITRKFGGTGLGLAICKQLVELMGGQIWVESVPSQGATFSFSISVKAVEEDEVSLLTKTQLESLNVLVVDDSDVSRQFTAEALLRMNVNPDLVSNGQQCIHKIRVADDAKKPVDLIILDWRMPDVDGIELASIIRQGNLSKQPSIVMLSSYDLNELKELGKPLNIDDYLSKPLNTSALLNCLSSLKDRHYRTTQIQPVIDESDLDLRGKNILLVEDNALNIKVAQGYLKETHAALFIAQNGQLAVDILKRDVSFDLILMDIQMPVMDGLTATRVIREELNLSIPIIAMTAHAMQGDIDKCLAVGMQAHIVKPIDSTEMFNTIRSVILGTSPLPKVKALVSSKTPESPQPDMESLLSIDSQRARKAVAKQPELYDKLIQDFLELESLAHDMKGAFDNQQLDELKQAVHTFKPALSYIGAFSLAFYADETELKLKACDAELTDEAQSHVITFIDAVFALIAKVKQDEGKSLRG